MVRALDLPLRRSRIRSQAVLLLGSNLGQVVHTHVPLSPSRIIGTGQGAVMPCGWEGNVGLASHWPCVADFSGLSTYGLTA